jgi:hypothetical protein
MTSESVSAVVEQTVEWTGMKNVPVEDRLQLVPVFWRTPSRTVYGCSRSGTFAARRIIRRRTGNGALPRNAEGTRDSVGVLKSRGVAAGDRGVHRAPHRSGTQLAIGICLAGIMVLNFVVMYFITRLTRRLEVTSTLQVVGSVLVFMEVALAIQIRSRLKRRSDARQIQVRRCSSDYARILSARPR